MPASSLLFDIPFTLDVVLLAKAVHLPDDPVDKAAFEALAARAQEIGRPKAIYRPGRITTRRPDAIVVDSGIELCSQALASVLSDEERLCFYCATCGTEVLALAEGLDIFQQYWLEEIKMVMLRAATAHLAATIRQEHGLSRLSGMGPGSGDVGVWDIAELAKIFQALGSEATTAAGVVLTESMLMLPNKTAAGVHFPLNRKFTACQLCHRSKCPNRRAPCDHGLWDAAMTGCEAGSSQRSQPAGPAPT
ncbi:MAG TPA: hypothetical protein PKY10_09035 [Lentisphaeria bacterium]|nr:hypothetical protein [Lentisphaeria bacterium]